MEEHIKELLKRYKANADQEIMLKIIKRMSPVIEKYVKLIHCLEPSDAKQELILALIEAIHKINDIENEDKCVGYLASYVKYKYVHICREYLKRKELEDITEIGDFDFKSSGKDSYEDCIFYIDLENYFQKQSNTKSKAIKYIILGYSDQEIAIHFNVSRQYINRLKKQMDFWNE